MELTSPDNNLAARFLLTPAFGQVTLSNCELEQIHLAGSIQPNGALLVVREPELVVIQASENAENFLGLRSAVLGRTLAALSPELSAVVGPCLAVGLDSAPIARRCRIGARGQTFDVLLHRPGLDGTNRFFVVELERAGAPVDFNEIVTLGLKSILAASSLRRLCDEAARLFRELTGYDRVMIYRFDEAGHGEVFSEARRPELEAFLGNRYPATDIPQMARRLYERNRVRVLVDIGYVPVPIVPAVTPATGTALDMSMCMLRSVSPIHVQYLKNMGVAATLVVSIMVGGRLWGLVSCHHYVPRGLQFELRAVCELLSEALATRIAALESFAQGQAELTVRRLEQRMIETISSKGDWRGALFESPSALLRPMKAAGAALLFEGEVLTVGEVPGTQQLREIAAWLDARPPAAVHASSSFGTEVPGFAPLIPVASGIVAVRISDTPGEYLAWFRPERVRTVTWGGNPYKAVVTGDDPRDLSPRRSFAQWHQVVEGTSDPWTAPDLTAAQLIGATVADVVLQFRSVRTLVALDQLEQVRRQVGTAEAPVLIGNAQGQVILANAAFEALLPGRVATLRRIDDLSLHCLEGAKIRLCFQEVLLSRRPWRGEVILKLGLMESKAFMVRADPVISAPDRVLGYVVMFTDMTERKAVDAARRRFQHGIAAEHRMAAGALQSQPGLIFQGLLSTILENAQLAALEITDGVDLGQVPAMLENVRTSVARAAEVLDHLMKHGTGDPRPSPPHTGEGEEIPR